MNNRVVITGMGVTAPNAIGIASFKKAIQLGISGIKFDPQLEQLKFSCQIAGKPELNDDLISRYFTPLELRNFNSSGITYGVIAGMEAWEDAGLSINETEEPYWDYGVIFGTGALGVDKFRDAVYQIDEGLTRRLGSNVVIQTMSSGTSAFLSGKIGLGNQVTTNSSACCTGTESLLIAFERIKTGQAQVMLAGATSDSGPYLWGGFDAMKVCTFKHNATPEKGSRPMSASASGFVPGSGSGAFVLESLDHALARGADIYAEILGGNLNSGGQRGAGTMTAPGPLAVQKCIRMALENSGIKPQHIDAINGHLTATSMDALEIRNWSIALQRNGKEFPYINSLKGMVGHCLSAAGSIECVAAVLQIKEDFVFPNINCEDLHPDILKIIDRERIPQKSLSRKIDFLMKASFGFGDVNACIVFKKYTKDE